MHFKEKRCHTFQCILASQEKHVVLGMLEIVRCHTKHGADDGWIGLRHAVQAFAFHEANGAVNYGFGCETMEIAILETEDIAN